MSAVGERKSCLGWMVGCGVGVWLILLSGLALWLGIRFWRSRMPSYEMQQLLTPVVWATPSVVPTQPLTPPTRPPRPQEEDLAEAWSTLRALERTTVPENDPLDLAQRLRGVTVVWSTPAAPPLYRVGDMQTFWVTDEDTTTVHTVEAQLAAVTAHVYLWVDTGVSYRPEDAEALAQFFEERVYPTNRAFFGSEWSPGIDGDPHIYILFARGLGRRLAGYFSSADELPPAVHEYSNAHEMFLLSADNLSLAGEEIRSVLAHEFQHMIHWYRDRNETTWLNEGFSELAAFLNGVRLGGFEFAYASDPDIQLTAWPDPADGDTIPHYGAAYLFVAYFLHRFGEQATRALVGHPANGMASVDAVLQSIGAGVNADDVFLDWVVANLVQQPDVDAGRYDYTATLDQLPLFVPTEVVTSCPGAWQTRTVRQYGVDYIRIACVGEYTLRFEGSATVTLLPTTPHSGRWMFWSNYGDESDMRLTRRFDLSTVQGPVWLTYWTWFDIEKNYDYLYVEASRDGEHWEILRTPRGTDEDPVGNSYGWGYTGASSGWVQEKVDLSAYAGGPVWVRFEYVTDAAVNRAGFVVDDIAIPALGYEEDFEQGDGGWKAEGFVRVGATVPQTYRLALVRYDAHNRVVAVEPVLLDADNSVALPLRLAAGESVVLVVTGTARVTRQPAWYRYRVEQIP